MKNKIIVFTILGILLLAGITITVSDNVKADEEIIVYVDDDADPSWYDGTHVKTIHEGIDNASISDTVYVYNGTYYENIIVNKRVNLVGEDRNNTIIYGNGTGDVVKLSVNGVELSGFTIRNSGCGNNGIKVVSNFNNIYDNIITDNYCGVFFYILSDQSDLTGNIIENNNFSGIYMELSSSIYIDSNIIADNNHGILTSIISSIKIIRNDFINNTCGINLSDDQPVDDIPGWVIFQITASSTFYNNFIDNDISAVDEFGIKNSWDNGYPLGGNYWDDYDGKDVDDDGDGIGDTPYNISGGDNKDYYPLMEPYSPPGKPELEITVKRFGIGRVSALIKNVGEINVSDISWDISVKGGLLGRINVSNSGTIDKLEPSSSKKVSTWSLGSRILRKFGRVYVTVAVTIDEETFEEHFYGFVIGRIYIDMTVKAL